MSSLKTGSAVLRRAATLRNVVKCQGSRGYSSKQGAAGYAAIRPLVVGGISLGAAYAAYKTYHQSKSLTLLPVAYAASAPECQPSNISETKEHALYLWIHLKPNANARECARVVANLQSHVDVVCPPDMKDESDEIFAGVGFSQDFYSKIGKAKENFKFAERAGEHGAMPATGGDIFIHAKSNSTSKLFELAQRITSQLPAGSIDKFEDIYGWVYQNGRDLSGFIDGTENPADDDDRRTHGVEASSGGSYVITQKWVHNIDLIAKEKDSTLESWLGRSRDDSVELEKKTITSHVARMTGGNAFGQKKKHEIVRQSQPYGSLSDKAGLFFIGYASSPEKLNYMLDRMTAKEDKHSDDVMRLTTCVGSNYFYFPGVAELKKLA